TVSPFVIGVFEFTMMRADGGVDFPRVARLFREYLAASGERVSVMRTMPHEEAVTDQPHVEVLDHEKAAAMVERAEGAIVGTCSCRHEKLHLGEKRCDVPLATCLSFGTDASSMVRRGLGRAVTKGEAPGPERGQRPAGRELPLPVLFLLLQRPRKYQAVRPAQRPRDLALHRRVGRPALHRLRGVRSGVHGRQARPAFIRPSHPPGKVTPDPAGSGEVQCPDVRPG
ncbi:MAG: hypothetical protein NTU62_03825, partial [Spirochaetes bacterium]|nr:hypothetical protein [Spirochaetota bacterium]